MRGWQTSFPEVARQSNVVAAAERALPAQQSPKGLGQGPMVAAFVVLRALGGEGLDDFSHLRWDTGLATLLGYPLPAASTARQWLDRFHFMRKGGWRTGRCQGVSTHRSPAGGRGCGRWGSTACGPTSVASSRGRR